MLTKAELDKKGIKYNEKFRWIWKSPNYMLQTCAFSEHGEYSEMTYKTYLERWCDKLNEENDGEFIVIERAHKKRKEVTIVEMPKKEA